MKNASIGFGLALLGCSSVNDKESADQIDRPLQPIELTTSPDTAGIPVGVRTIEYGGETLEVWYPAVDPSDEWPAEPIDFESFISASFQDAIEGFELPIVPGTALPGAPVRDAGEPLPVLLFSHGFGGMRVQSFGLTTHLASRGYVVIAPDHPGRMLTDVLPCIFSPPLEGCDLSGFGLDPGPGGLAVALQWVDEATTDGDFAGSMDPDRIGILGHSAGAGSVTQFADLEPRVSAVLPMAGGSVPEREVPTLRMDGSCDGFVAAAAPTSVDGRPLAEFVTVHGAGHLAFSDLCALDIAGFADRFLEDRDDLNSLFYPQLRGLGTDGCEGAEPQLESDDCDGAFLPLEESDVIVRYYSTVFFDRSLKGVEPSTDLEFDAASVYRP